MMWSDRALLSPERSTDGKPEGGQIAAFSTIRRETT